MEIEEITLDSIIKANPKHLDCELEDQAVLLDLNAKRYFGLNEVGLRIWQLSKKQIAIKSIIKTLKDEFEVDEAECQKDCLVFIKDLKERDLVEIVYSK